jgi:hypothetical protein
MILRHSKGGFNLKSRLVASLEWKTRRNMENERLMNKAMHDSFYLRCIGIIPPIAGGKLD